VRLESWFIIMDIFQLVMTVGLFFLVDRTLRELQKAKPPVTRFVNRAHGRRSGKK
jgi:hypothetical protein